MKTNLPPHLNPLPQGGEKTRFHIPPLPRGEGRGEGKAARHRRIRVALLGILLLVAGNAALAQPFNNWPTYASAPLTNWPKATEYQALIEDLTWCYGALTERSEVVGTATTGIAPKPDGPRLPKTDIERMKDQVELLIPDYVDQYKEGSFTNLSEFPKHTETGLLSHASQTIDFLDSTPYSRHLNDVLPAGVTTNYGMPGLKNSILELKWTDRRCRDADTGSHSAARAERAWSCQVKHDTWGQARTCAETHYDEGWVTDSGMYYYRLSRGLGYSPYVYVGWLASVARNRSTPQCSGIVLPDGVSFDWEAWLKPTAFQNDCGVSYDGYSGWVYDRLKKWDSGAGVSTNAVQAQQIGGQDETFPFDLDPELVGSNRTTHGVSIAVRDFYWLFKWDFQCDE